MEGLWNIYNVCTYKVRSHFEAHLFGGMQEDECDYDHTFIDDSSASRGDKGELQCLRRQFKHVQGC